MPSLAEINKSLAEDSLAEYVRQAWPVIEPETPYLHNWHIDLICEYLERVTSGGATRLIINIPPRYMKSILVSVLWPTWAWIKRPSARWIFASYSGLLSKKHSLDRRTTLQSEWYQGNWGDRVAFTPDQNEKMEYENTARGYMVATSVGGTITGKGGNFIVVDDPHNPVEAMSALQRRNAIAFFSQTLSTRLNDKKKDAIVLIMQRLHEDDLTGHLLASGGWEHLCLPALAEGSQEIDFPVSGKKFCREDGSLLWQDREGNEEINRAKMVLGGYGFAGQYQQRPAPLEGGIIKKHWFRFWYSGPVPSPISIRLADGSLHECDQIKISDQFDQTCQSWDMAFKDTNDSAYVVGQSWGRRGQKYFLLDQDRKKRSFVESISAVHALATKWPKIAAILIEDKANGPAIISSLKERISGIVPIEPKGNKESRLFAISPYVEAGDVYLPHPSIHPWVEDFISEWISFPNSAYADQVDAGTQALSYLKKRDFSFSAVGETEFVKAWR